MYHMTHRIKSQSMKVAGYNQMVFCSR